MKHAAFLKSVAVLTLGSLAAKGVGALYRIALANALGSYGTGLYQMAYPLFVVLLAFSSAGIPSALSRTVARERAAGRGSGGTVAAALRLFALLGLAGSLLMCLLAPAVSRLQGDAGLAPCYFALAPSVFLVALVAVLRGYFQGKNDMAPTAVSEIAEQGAKAAFGLLFAGRASDPVSAAAGALFGVTVSEAVALLVLAVRCRGERRTPFGRRTTGGEVLRAALPVMASSSLLPLSQMADSVVVVRLLSAYEGRAVALYGLLSGGAASLVGLPAALSCGLAAAVVPAVSSVSRGDGEEGRLRALYALALTLAFSVPCAAGLFLFAPQAVSILYPALSAGDARMLVSLVRLSSVSAATLAGVHTLAACLTGMGKAGRAALSMLAAVLVKHALQFVLVPVPALSVGGAAIAANACYLVAFSLDLFYTVRKEKRRKGYDHYRKSRRDGGRSHGAGEADALAGGRSARADGRASLG